MPPSVRGTRIPRCPRPERRVIETRLRRPVVLSLRRRSRPFWPAPLAASVAKGWSRALTVYGCGVTIPVRHRPRARNRASESLRATRHQTSWPAGAPQGTATGRTPVGPPTAHRLSTARRTRRPQRIVFCRYLPARRVGRQARARPARPQPAQPLQRHQRPTSRGHSGSHFADNLKVRARDR